MNSKVLRQLALLAVALSLSIAIAIPETRVLTEAMACVALGLAAYLDRRCLPLLPLLALTTAAEVYLHHRQDMQAAYMISTWLIDPRTQTSPLSIVFVLCKLFVIASALLIYVRAPQAKTALRAMRLSEAASSFRRWLAAFRSASSPRLAARDSLLLLLIATASLFFSCYRLGSAVRPTTGVSGRTKLLVSTPSPVAELWLYKSVASADIFVHCEDGGNEQQASFPDFEAFGWYYRRLVKPCGSSFELVVDIKQGQAYELILADGQGLRIMPTRICAVEPTGTCGDAKSTTLFDESELVVGIPDRYDGAFYDEGFQIDQGSKLLLFPDSPYRPSAHPLGGRLPIFLAMDAWGIVPFAWRLPDALAGAAMPLALFFLALVTLGRKDVAFLAAFLSLLDTGRLSLSRVATTDSQLALWNVLAALFLCRFARAYLRDADQRPLKQGRQAGISSLLLLGCCIGAAFATKWSGSFMVPCVAGIYATMIYVRLADATPSDRGRIFLTASASAITCLVLVPASIYAGVFGAFSQHVGAVQFHQIAADAGRMLNFHSSFLGANPYQSQFLEWPWITRPIALFARYGLPVGSEARTFIVGNPSIYWLIVPATIYAFATGTHRERPGIVFVLAFFLTTYAAWAAVGRSTYLYHFAPIAPFGMILIADAAISLRQRSATLFGAYLLVVVVSFLWFLPIATGIEMPARYFASVSWFQNWFAILDPRTNFVIM